MKFNYEVHEIKENYDMPLIAKGVINAITANEATEEIQNFIMHETKLNKNNFSVRIETN